MKAPRIEYRFLDAEQRKIKIHLDFVPEELVVICWDVDPVAGGGTPTKPPKKVEFETAPAPPQWPPSD